MAEISAQKSTSSEKPALATLSKVAPSLYTNSSWSFYRNLQTFVSLLPPPRHDRNLWEGRARTVPNLFTLSTAPAGQHPVSVAWALGVGGASTGSPSDDSPPFTLWRRRQRHCREQGGGGSGVWLLRSRDRDQLRGEPGATSRPRTAQARRGQQQATRNPGTRRGGSPPPPRPRRPRLATKPGGTAAGPNGWQGRLSLTGVRFLVPESTALLGRSVASALATDTQRTQTHTQGVRRSSGGEMAPIAAPRRAGSLR